MPEVVPLPDRRPLRLHELDFDGEPAALVQAFHMLSEALAHERLSGRSYNVFSGWLKGLAAEGRPCHSRAPKMNCVVAVSG